MATTLQSRISEAKHLFHATSPVRLSNDPREHRFIAGDILDIKYTYVESLSPEDLAICAFEMAANDTSVCYEETPSGSFRDLVKMLMFDFIGDALERDHKILAESIRRNGIADRMNKLARVSA
ncbi:MAG TPA: hypothetical protein VLF41_02745 [Candidatus Nanoarchaeia archaeon]|nr:hypothetical protein [Candidatus Nanoarchaeia archaeon]